ncbi:TetR/AcrR family transcriptional regulator [Nakamurella sp. PAMC28650]|uniref:TetR/AcrR family transcriptional regulator n=1 Tax=Nakamurella sp. PAMC28650 TaxID=2762325 RepID=UPI001C9AC2E8|nr:TetR/AcrR family transcriptional regulator C-terminal domain-containing protein [Nakamurella sp. PAMC28650]
MNTKIDPDSPRGRGSAAAVLPTAAPGAGAGPGNLDRRTILGGAIAMVDRDGLRGLTMRKLGAYLGVEGMALYRYVAGRDALLDGIVEVVIDELYGDPDVHLHSDDWADYLQRLAHGIRRIALAHPQLFPLIATRPPAAPWVRPPLRSLRWMESFLQNFRDCEFSDRAAVAAYQAFSSFLLGHLLLEVSAQGADIGPVDDADPGTPQTSDLDGYPLLQHLKPLLSENRSAEVFQSSLGLLVAHLETLGKN